MLYTILYSCMLLFIRQMELSDTFCDPKGLDLLELLLFTGFSGRILKLPFLL